MIIDPFGDWSRHPDRPRTWEPCRGDDGNGCFIPHDDCHCVRAGNPGVEPESLLDPIEFDEGLR